MTPPNIAVCVMLLVRKERNYVDLSRGFRRGHNRLSASRTPWGKECGPCHCSKNFPLFCWTTSQHPSCSQACLRYVQHSCHPIGQHQGTHRRSYQIRQGNTSTRAFVGVLLGVSKATSQTVNHVTWPMVGQAVDHVTWRTRKCCWSVTWPRIGRAVDELHDPG